jgi:hypothetical protein
MKKITLIFFLMLMQEISLLAQEKDWTIIQRISIDDIDLVSMDNQHQIYISNTKGDLFKFNPLGQLISNFSPVWQGKLSQLDASWTFHVFTFSVDLQEYRFLDRLMQPLSENRLQNLSSGMAKVVTPSTINALWIWDESELSLIKWDLKKGMVLQVQPLHLLLSELKIQVIDIKEHHNLLFVLLKNHRLLILDLQANIIADYENIITTHLKLQDNFLVYKEGELLKVFDWKQNKIQFLDIPASLKNYEFIKGKDAWLAYNKNELLLVKQNQ